MPVIAIHKSETEYEFPNVPAAKRAIKAKGLNVNDYIFKYIYDQMARKPYSAGYKERHNEASLRYYHKTKVLKNES